MYSNINDLLNNPKSATERFQELLKEMPSLLDGKKIFYQQEFYIRYDKETESLFAGSNRYPKETKVSSAFPYVFYLSGIYTAKVFADIYKSSENLQKNKQLHLDENNFVVLKDYGVVSSETIIKDLIEEAENPKEEIVSVTTEESIVEKELSNIETIIESETILEEEKSKKKNTKKKKGT